MKSNSIISINRNGKTILIYLKQDQWTDIPNLSFIEDVEVYDSKKELENMVNHG